MFRLIRRRIGRHTQQRCHTLAMSRRPASTGQDWALVRLCSRARVAELPKRADRFRFRLTPFAPHTPQCQLLASLPHRPQRNGREWTAVCLWAARLCSRVPVAALTEQADCNTTALFPQAASSPHGLLCNRHGHTPVCAVVAPPQGKHQKPLFNRHRHRTSQQHLEATSRVEEEPMCGMNKIAHHNKVIRPNMPMHLSNNTPLRRRMSLRGELQ